MKMNPAITVGAFIAVALGVWVTFFGFGSSSAPILQACTMEAKVCPDGSSVGRSGPNCEFAECPDTPVVSGSGGYECDGDGKICPDGSVVGRTGAICEFAACPSANATSATITTTMGQKMTGLYVSITPLEIVEDSRCPNDVQCIWAGTVKVKVRIDSGMGTAYETLELGKPITTEAEEITLTSVTPNKNPEKDPPLSSYRFVFEVKKR